jgi:acyl-CoA synthetase (AMP-forming)/AMP-acid ligase II
VAWSLAGIIREHARARGEAPALTYGRRTSTWRDLDERSSAVGQGLLAAGLAAQDRVAFVDKNGPEYFEVLFGGAKANVVNVAVNWRLTPAEMAYIINDAGARVLFLGADFLPHLDALEPALKTVERIIVLGEHPRHPSYEAWRADHRASDPGRVPTPSDVAMQLYTSGTTGLPKGAMLANTNLGTLLPYVPGWWNVDASSVSLVCMPLFHIGGSGWALVGMGHGAHSILVRDFVPAEILDILERQRVTNALFVPAMLQFLTMVPGAADRDYSALRSIVYGASPITNEVLVRAMATFRCPFVQVYGLTETTGAITQLPPEDHDPDGPRSGLLRSAGKPFPWVELRIVDPATGADARAGEVGEVWTRSPQNFVGYWNRPDESARTLVADGWLRTGDAGYLDADGYLFLTDRVKDMIITGGENVYPAEVENALAEHSAVADVAVIGVPDDRWGETVKAVVVPRSGDARPDPTLAADIIAFARSRLAHFKCPTSVDFATTLPRNPSGKLLKRELREPYWGGRERRIN